MQLRSCLLAGLLLAAAPALAQTTPTPPPAAPADSLDFGEFGDADAQASRAYATQKVLYLSPTKLISVGYETQTGFDLTARGPQAASGTAPEVTTPVNRFGGLRLGFNAPVISRSSFILNLGLTYWNTGVGLDNAEQRPLFTALRRGLRSTGVNATVFKPFDNKHFLLLQANADLNGNYRGFDDLSGEALTYSGTAIYGWKPNDNFMWGLGLTRTYRAGQLLHIPVVFYNRTFSPRWGVEAVFPARVNLRRSFGTSSLLMFGYELEGNTYYLGPVGGQELFLRRGEMKPRITYERQLAGFVWLSAQVGYRYNWRFDVYDSQNPGGSNREVYTNTLGNPLYFNLSVNLVSP
ncbi:DUF6268 family outer membrane beta-barrel protein [Hymenobacter oligotrophus]|uniref:DUF6268 family outer membrane beta-barrel protein n=1 Tax=Hymenobacter oligotrophus TaxID=2319843 RepID=UPI001F08FF3B|nr:DUF6268 family outer membrane beta-barrel protein [Hymenobacter oligotrophus]